MSTSLSSDRKGQEELGNDGNDGHCPLGNTDIHGTVNAVMMMVVLCAQQQTFGDGGKSGKVHFLSPFAGIQWRGVQS